MSVGYVGDTDLVGKQSRRPNRRNRPRGKDRQTASVGAGGRMKLAIVTYPVWDRGGPALAKDVELVRASILYADEVELVSLGAFMMASVVQFAAGDDADRLSLMSALDDDTVRALGGGGLPDNWREILPAALQVMRLDPEVLRGLPGGDQVDLAFFDQQREWRREMEEAVARFRETAENMLVQSGGHELIPAFDAGILKLSASGFTEDSDTDGAIDGWIGLLKGLLQDPSTRLLFDDGVGDLIRSLVDEGHVLPHGLTLKHAGEAAVGSGLVARLPTLPDSPVDEILDLRRDLAVPLTRYRAAVSRLADKLAFRAFDPESATEIDDLWTREVAPALVEIEEGFAEHGLVREVAKTIGADLKTMIREGAALYVGLGTLTSLNKWIASTAAVAGPVAEAAARAATASRTARRELRGRELYYLYEVNRRL